VTAATGHHPQDDLPGLLLGELPPATAVAVASSALRDASRLRFPETAEVPPLPSSFPRDRRRRSPSAPPTPARPPPRPACGATATTS
jgi:hypothetical protein